MARLLYLIRHGALPEAFAGRYVGSASDPPLSPEGCRQGEALRDLACDLVVSSPALRARQTAAFLTAPCQIDPRIREIDFGEWEGKKFAEIQSSTNAPLIRIWTETPQNMVFPGGESVPSFYARIEEALRDLMKRPEERIAVVTHGGVLMHWRAHLRGLPPVREQECLPPRGSVVEWRFHDGQWQEE